MERLFAWNNGHWWLMLKSEEDVRAYMEEVFSIQREKALSDEEDVKKGYHSSNALAENCRVLGWGRGLPFPLALDFLTAELEENLLKGVREGKIAYLNRVGGFNFSVKPERIYKKEGFEFPSFSREDIRIKQWPGGKHFYAYIGNMEIRDENGNIKWNTREEAERQAEKYVKRS